MNGTLHTKFGTAKLQQNGYYIITSCKEGHGGKRLHRLIWEDFYGCEIPKGYIIHHRNNIKTDNCILNLQLMRDSDHKKIHSETRSEETKQKMSKSRSGCKNPMWKNYPRVKKNGFRNNKQIYAITHKGKVIKTSIFLHKLYKWWGENHPIEFLYLEI